MWTKGGGQKSSETELQRNSKKEWAKMTTEGMEPWDKLNAETSPNKDAQN